MGIPTTMDDNMGDTNTNNNRCLHMSFDLEAKKAELEALKKENEYQEQKELLEEQIKAEKKKKRERSLLGQLWKEIK